MLSVRFLLRPATTLLLLLLLVVEGVNAQARAKRPVSAGSTGTCPALPSEITAARILDKPCYALTSYTSISGEVTIAPGVTITASQSAAINVKDNGSLFAIGTAEKPIVFHGKDRLAGAWRGITFSNASAKNRLSYVHVEDAGANNGSNSGAIFIFGAAGVDHSTIVNSATVGVRVDGIGRLLDFTGNRLEQNDLPIDIPAEWLGMIDGATEFVGNKQQTVRVSRSEVEKPAIWHALSVPVSFASHAQIQAAVSLEPGLSLQFLNGTSIYVQHAGSFHAVGTAAKPIVLTGLGALPGAWDGVQFLTADAKNTLEFVHIDYAGSAYSHAAVVVGQEGFAQIRHVSIAHSLEIGVLINLPGRTQPGAAALAAANTFADLGGQAVVERR